MVLNLELLAAADGFMLAMLAAMLLSLGIVALLVLCGLRNAARRNPYVDELLDEVAAEAEQPTPTRGESAKPAEAWEVDADWWKR